MPTERPAILGAIVLRQNALTERTLILRLAGDLTRATEALTYWMGQDPVIADTIARLDALVAWAKAKEGGTE